MLLSFGRLAARKAAAPSCTKIVPSCSAAAAPNHRSLHSYKEDDHALKKLFKNNREWVDKVNKDDPTFFPKLGSGQSPEYLYIGCSDSRVSISSLIGLEMGELFVHRNIANMVVASDLNLLSVMTYAVEHLKVKHILLTGHYDCGGVRAAMTPKDGTFIYNLSNDFDVFVCYRKKLWK